MKALYKAIAVPSVQRSLFRKMSRWSNGAVVKDVSTNGGRLTFDLTLGDPVQTGLYLDGIFEPAVSERMVQLVSGTPVVFYDIGCNIGYFSSLVGVHAPQATIIALDANPTMVDRCTENNRRNGVKATMLNLGVGATRSRLDFVFAKDRPSQGSFGNAANASGATTLVVDVVPISEIIDAKGLPFPEIIKIDVEGFEPAFFRGLADRHFAGVQHLVIEHAIGHMAKCGFTPADLWSDPRMRGFRYEALGADDRWRPIRYEDIANFDGMLHGARI